MDQALFEAVQAKLADGAVTRRLRLKASPAILMGRIYDDRGNRMTPSHANKHGVRYRYYISHALLQKRTDEAGHVPRVPAPEVEHLVVKALRELSDKAADGCPPRLRMTAISSSNILIGSSYGRMRLRYIRLENPTAKIIVASPGDVNGRWRITASS